MMRKLAWLLVGIPVAIVLIVMSVANRQMVTFRLDPFNAENPALAVTLPFFVYLFAAVLAGILIGGFFSWLSQGRFRRTARSERIRANRLEDEAAAQKKRAEQLVAQASGERPAGGSEGFPLLTRNDRAA